MRRSAGAERPVAFPIRWVDGRREEDFTRWPPTWSRPPLPESGIATYRAEEEIKRRKFETPRHIKPANFTDYYDDD